MQEGTFRDKYASGLPTYGIRYTGTVICKAILRAPRYAASGVRASWGGLLASWVGVATRVGVEFCGYETYENLSVEALRPSMQRPLVHVPKSDLYADMLVTKHTSFARGD